MAILTSPAQTLVKSAVSVECSCCELDLAVELLRSYDSEVAKALGVSELAQMARAEARIRNILLKRWELRAAQASHAAGRIVGGGGAISTAMKSVNSIMNRWKDDVKSQYKKELKLVYALGAKAGRKRMRGKAGSLRYDMPNFTEQIRKAKPEPDEATLHAVFDLPQDAAAEALAAQELMWIGETYEGLAPALRAALAQKFTEGMTRAEAGEAVANAVKGTLESWSIPSGWRGSAAKYFEGVAANAVTNARVQSQLTSFALAGATSYQLVNPMDERTTPICALMNGQVFTIDEGADQMAATRAATTPDEYRAAHPWLSLSSVIDLKAGGQSAMASGGLALPPFHFRCRTTIDIYG